MTEAELITLVKKAQAKYDALSPLEQARHNYDQQRSYVRGEMGFEHPDWSVEEINRIIDRGELKMGIVRP